MNIQNIMEKLIEQKRAQPQKVVPAQNRLFTGVICRVTREAHKAL